MSGEAPSRRSSADSVAKYDRASIAGGTQGRRVIAGFKISERYRLDASEDLRLPETEAWLATDLRLAVPVTVLVVGGAGHLDVEAAAERARVARDPRLARIIEVGTLDAEEPGERGRSYVVLERPEGVSLADLLGSRRVPARTARALAGEAGRAVEAALHLGLRHGAITPDLITVADGGRVILAGAGIVPAILATGDKPRVVADRDDAVSIGQLFVRAATGKPALDASAADYPIDLTAPERDLAHVVSRGVTRPALGDVLRALTPWEPGALRGLRDDLLSFPRLVPLPAIPAPAPAVVEPEAATDEIPVVSPSRAAGVGLAPEAPSEVALEDAWGFEALEPIPGPDEVPTLTEGIIVVLRRRFPDSPLIARLANAAEARALAGPRFDATPWLLGVGVVVLVVAGLVGIRLLTGPFVFKGDLHNPPQQTYPPYTFGSTVTPSSSD